VGLGAVTVVAFAATVVALDQRRAAGERADEAASARSVAVTGRLVSDAVQLAPTNRRVALLLAAEAYRRQPDPASLGALKDVLAASTDVLGYVGADAAFTDVAWTRDGRIVGTHSEGLVVIDDAGRRELDVLLTGSSALAVRGDDRIAAVGGSDETVRIVDLTSGAQVGEPLDHGSPLQAVAFGRESPLLATGDRAGVVRLFDERFTEIHRIDAFTDVDPNDLPDGVPPPLPHDPSSFREGVTDVAVSADGSVVAAVGGVEFAIWDTQTGRELVRQLVTKVHGGSERAAVPTAIGFVIVEGVERVAVVEVHSASIHDLSGRRVDRWTLTTGTTQVVARQTAAFADDTVMSALDDGKFRIARAGDELTVVDSHLGPVVSVEVEPGGRRAVVAGEEGALIVSLVGEGLISRSVDGLDRQEVTVSTDGRTVVNSGIGGIGSRLWVLSGGRFQEMPMPGSTEEYALNGLPFGMSYDERTLTARLRDPFTMEPYGPSFGPGGAAGQGMSRDGRWLALGGTRQINPDQLEVLVWDTVSGDLVARLDGFATDRAEVVRAITFSPDDRKLLVAADDGRGVFYDTRTWEAIEPVLGGVVEAAYSHDGRLLVTVSIDGAITFRDPVTLQPDGPPLLGNTDGVEGFSFGPFFTDDDRFMITAADGELRLFDVEQRVLVGGPFPRAGDRTGIATRNGRYGVTAIDDTAMIWEIDPDRWPEIACRAAGRNLTPDEWAQFGPSGEPYRATCDQWPSLADSDRTDQKEVGT
jgi:WD40 repeat protein